MIVECHGHYYILLRDCAARFSGNVRRLNRSLRNPDASQGNISSPSESKSSLSNRAIHHHPMRESLVSILKVVSVERSNVQSRKLKSYPFSIATIHKICSVTGRKKKANFGSIPSSMGREA